MNPKTKIQFAKQLFIAVLIFEFKNNYQNKNQQQLWKHEALIVIQNKSLFKFTKQHVYTVYQFWIYCKFINWNYFLNKLQNKDVNDMY